LDKNVIDSTNSQEKRENQQSAVPSPVCRGVQQADKNQLSILWLKTYVMEGVEKSGQDNRRHDTESSLEEGS